jgi:MFS family permease
MLQKEKLWTPSFIILWQSQLVSTLGDAVYSIALGFWVLAVTGSTALMGMLMAVSTLPGILVAPFAGVLIDRTNKKRLMIAMDLLRGVAVVLLAVAAYGGFIQVWMVFAAGILLSACGAVFSPGVASAVPELVPASRMANANSVFSAVYTGSNLIGSAAGGFLFQTLGAPLLFLINGLSFLFSGASLPFVRIPSNKRREKLLFFKDMAEGFRYMWRQAGLRFIIIIASFNNFFFMLALTLFVPLCKYTPGLGTAKYGILMACFTGGGVVGYLLLSTVAIKAKNKLKYFILSDLIYSVLLIALVNLPYFGVMAGMLIAAGVFNAVVNVILVSTVQVSTPHEFRGKVMSFINMTAGGLTPVAMALGGLLGENLPITLVMTASYAAALLVSVPAFFSKSFRAYITAESAAKYEETE